MDTSFTASVQIVECPDGTLSLLCKEEGGIKAMMIHNLSKTMVEMMKASETLFHRVAETRGVKGFVFKNGTDKNGKTAWRFISLEELAGENTAPKKNAK